MDGRNVLAHKFIATLLVGLAVSGCTLGPDYQKPTVETGSTFKEIKGWRIARPRDALDRGEWWKLYKDPILNDLESQVAISNQTLAAAEAAFRQSAALVAEARSSFFPTISKIYNPEQIYAGPGANGTGKASLVNKVTLETTATWDLDVWGKVRRMVESNIDLAQASAADVANARLTAQGQLAVAYFNLRASDSLQKLLARTVAEYKRTQTITENQYAAGTAARSDVLTAQTQVRTTEAQLINAGVARAQFEHAIAVLIGRPPSELTIKPRELGNTIPVVPPGTPAALLERRPDIAGAERRVAGQEALIGVAVTAYFPDITLNGLAGWVGPQAIPIRVANAVYQYGATATETLFNGGLTRAQIAAAEATYYQAVAIYRQTVFAAFQTVEDNLSSLRILVRQQAVQDDAVRLSRQAVDIALNEYRAGTAAFTAVVTAQATLLANEQAALTVRQNRYLASVNLIQALGGGWNVDELPGYEELRERWSCVNVRAAIRGTIPKEMPGCL